MLTKKGNLDKRYKWFCFDYKNGIPYAQLYELIEQFCTEIASRFCWGYDLHLYSYTTAWANESFIVSPSKDLYDVHCQRVPAILFSFENIAEVEKFKAYRQRRQRAEAINEILQDLEDNPL